MIRADVNLVLMGLRGSGKSTIGRGAAALLGREFVDLDDRTAAIMGVADPAAGLRALGEPAFRAAETQALSDALVAAGQVISLGGGTPTAPGAMELLEAQRNAGRAVIVYLRAEPEVLRARLAATDTSARPSLTGRGTLVEIEELFSARDPLYQRLASHTVDAGAGSVSALTAQVVALDVR